MKKIQELIERFKELSKNTNMSYGAAPNMSGSGNGDMAAKAEANPKSKPKKPSGGTPPANPMPPRPAEMIKWDKNGQWSLDKAQVPGSKYPPAAQNPLKIPQATSSGAAPKFGPINPPKKP